MKIFLILFCLFLCGCMGGLEIREPLKIIGFDSHKQIIQTQYVIHIGSSTTLNLNLED